MQAACGIKQQEQAVSHESGPSDSVRGRVRWFDGRLMKCSGGVAGERGAHPRVLPSAQSAIVLLLCIDMLA